MIYIFSACNSGKKIMHVSKPENRVSGSGFYHAVSTLNVYERDSMAMKSILNGNIPPFFKRFEKVIITTKTKTGVIVTAILYVSRDYLSVGVEDDWARIPLMPKTAQSIANTFDCFLPTPKIVDEIYKQSSLKLEPLPLVSARDSSATFLQHHQMIEAQRQGRTGLTAGIKKDIVIADKLLQYPKKDRVAIYGWHKLDGKPIQPLYTGHVDWYVDYSHGVRLISRKIKIKSSGKLFARRLDYKDVLKDPELKGLLSDDTTPGFYAY
jgi:hypothetical protein